MSITTDDSPPGSWRDELERCKAFGVGPTVTDVSDIVNRMPHKGVTWEPWPHDPPEGWPYQYVAKADYDVLAARLADAERDARRYRWLRSEEANTDPRYFDFWLEFSVKLCREGRMDALIDSAIAAQEDKP